MINKVMDDSDKSLAVRFLIRIASALVLVTPILVE